VPVGGNKVDAAEEDMPDIASSLPDGSSNGDVTEKEMPDVSNGDGDEEMPDIAATGLDRLVQAEEDMPEIVAGRGRSQSDSTKAVAKRVGRQSLNTVHLPKYCTYVTSLSGHLVDNG